MGGVGQAAGRTLANFNGMAVEVGSRHVLEVEGWRGCGGEEGVVLREDVGANSLLAHVWVVEER